MKDAAIIKVNEAITVVTPDVLSESDFKIFILIGCILFMIFLLFVMPDKEEECKHEHWTEGFDPHCKGCKKSKKEIEYKLR
jgi:hypothetical protein